jgi:hypothetical protein
MAQRQGDDDRLAHDPPSAETQLALMETAESDVDPPVGDRLDKQIRGMALQPDRDAGPGPHEAAQDRRDDIEDHAVA